MNVSSLLRSPCHSWFPFRHLFSKATTLCLFRICLLFLIIVDVLSILAYVSLSSSKKRPEPLATFKLSVPTDIFMFFPSFHTHSSHFCLPFWPPQSLKTVFSKLSATIPRSLSLLAIADWELLGVFAQSGCFPPCGIPLHLLPLNFICQGVPRPSMPGNFLQPFAVSFKLPLWNDCGAQVNC